MGSLYQPGGLVFATESGALINPSNLRQRSFKPLLKRAGLPDICFHDLRHTCATRMEDALGDYCASRANFSAVALLV